MEQEKVNYKCKELKGRESITLAYIFANFLALHLNTAHIRGEMYNLENTEELEDFFEKSLNQMFLYQFEKEEFETILFFFEDTNGISLDDKGIEITPIVFKELVSILFRSLFHMKIHTLEGFNGYTFIEAYKQLCKNHNPSEIELKSIYELMN